MSSTMLCYHFDNVLCILNPIIMEMHRMEIGHAFSFLGAFFKSDSRLGCHLEHWSYASFAKVANA